MPEVITHHLDLWTSALRTKSSAGRGGNGKLEAYGIKKLRELILELAVRGKLVAQDPNDEPASELLEQVAVDKAQMVSAGKIRKEKDFPAIADDEIPFNLPIGWEWARINDVGHDWGQKPPDADFTYVDVSAIDNSLGVISGPSVLSASEAPSRARKIVKRGTVIYSTVRPYLKNICVIEEDYSPEPIASTAFAVLHLFQGMPGRFFALYFRSPEFVKYVESVQTGIAYPAINDKQFYGGLVPIPPLAEQHRIVAKVDELMALCDQLEQQQTDSLAAHQTLVETLLGTLTRPSSVRPEPVEGRASSVRTELRAPSLSRGRAVEARPSTGSGRTEFEEAWARIASHFDTLFTTEASINQLKQTLLQLAVMGKLVPQDPNDESAEALLIRVSSAKEQLILERKIRQSDEAELSEPNELFDIPVGWMWIHVKDVAIIQGGKRLPNGTALLETPTPHIYIRVTDMKNGTVSETGLMYMSPDVQRQISRYTINKEDLYITIAGTIGDVGIIPDALDGQNLTENAAKIVFRVLDKRFFVLALSSDFVQAQFLEKTKQMAQPKLALKRIAGAKFCLPPLNEQHRIVAKVDELMALCDTLKARIKDAQTTQIHLADAIVEQAVA